MPKVTVDPERMEVGAIAARLHKQLFALQWGHGAQLSVKERDAVLEECRELVRELHARALYPQLRLVG